MSEKIKCDKCKKEFDEKDWKGKIHEIIDEFDTEYRFDICYECEQVLTADFLKTAASFFTLSNDITVWRVSQ